MQAAKDAERAFAAPFAVEEPFTSGHFTLLMRVAKLVGTTAEFICVVRELSATEVKLRIFHALPENRFALELPGGDFYFVEKLWERESEAGFRFSAPIDIDTFVSEASPYATRQVRLRTSLAAAMSLGEATSPVLIRDLSQEGARLEASVSLGLYQRLTIDAEAFAVPMIGTIHWKSNRQYGVLFQRAFGLGELARIAWSLYVPASATPERPGRFEVVRDKRLE